MSKFLLLNLWQSLHRSQRGIRTRDSGSYELHQDHVGRQDGGRSYIPQLRTGSDKILQMHVFADSELRFSRLN
jgi:hypothetical protein